jgi:hypothetical protein
MLFVALRRIVSRSVPTNKFDQRKGLHLLDYPFVSPSRRCCARRGWTTIDTRRGNETTLSANNKAEVVEIDRTEFPVNRDKRGCVRVQFIESKFPVSRVQIPSAQNARTDVFDR